MRPGEGPLSGGRLLASDVPPQFIRRLAALKERFAADECWIINRGDRYVQVRYAPDYVALAAHRLVAALAHGEVPEGLVAMHTCDVPGCLNPAHIIIGTHRQNQRMMSDKGRAGWTKATAEERHALGHRVVEGKIRAKGHVGYPQI